MGDRIKMVFGDYYDRFLTDRGHYGRSSNKISISKEEYRVLKDKAKKYEAVASNIETLRLENRELKDVLKNLKEDARDYKDLKEETEKYMASLIRVQADFENYKKIKERERRDYKIRATEIILKKLIKHYDDLIRALEVIDNVENGDSIKKGFEIILKNFEHLLKEEGVKPMNAEGQEFDPYKHEVLMCAESDLPENTIIEELDKGYYINNKVLRPAKVIISKNLNLNNKKENENENQTKNKK